MGWTLMHWQISQHDGERLFMWKLAKIERFDVVAAICRATLANAISSVIGVPGDTIEVRDDKLYLNGVATDEPYLAGSEGISGGQSEWQLLTQNSP